MKFLLFVVLCVFLVKESKGSSFGYARNVSLTGLGNDDFHYRRTSVASWSVGAITSGVYFSSISVGRTDNSAEGDAVWGASWVGPTSPPLGFLSYWDRQANWDSGTDFAALNVSASAAYIASAYLSLEERDINNTLIHKQDLSNTLNPFTFQWQLTGTGVGDDVRIKWATFTGYLPGASWNISLTHVISDVVGVLNVANAIVSPKSYETIVTINNYPYASPDNYLSLILGVASGEASAEAYAFVSGTGANKTYYRVGATATVDGVTKNVESSGFSPNEYDGYIEFLHGTSLWTQLSDRFGGDAEWQLVAVYFPANAHHIVYDPDVGAGNPVGQATTTGSGASALSYGALLIFFSILLSLF